MKGNFENSLTLTKFILRRERISSTAWVVLVVLIVSVLAVSMYNILDGPSRIELVSILANPAFASMLGPDFVARYAPDSYGALFANMMLLLIGVVVGIFNIFLVVRHTRADEEMGRYEVLRSLPTGRMANLHAVMITAVIVNVALAVIMGIAMFAVGDSSMTFGGSMLWGVALGVVGLFFAAVAAVFSQLSSTSRGAKFYSIIVLLFFYFMRGIGDINADMEILSLINPLGLMLRTLVYIQNYRWPVWILLASTIAITFIAYRLNAFRDIDQGILPGRPGRAHGGFLLKSPIGLSIKLCKNTVIWTVAGMFLLGAIYAAVLADIDEFIAHNELYQSLILGPAGFELSDLAGMETEQILSYMREIVSADPRGLTITSLYASMINMMTALIGLAVIITLAKRVMTEEKNFRSELILTTPTNRSKYLIGYCLIALITAVLMQAAFAFGLYVFALGAVEPGELSLGFVMEAAMVYLPALWTMIGISILLVGFLPHRTGLMWGYYGYSFIVMFVHRMGALPDWTIFTTPFGFVPQVPMEEVSFLTLGILTVIAIVLTVVGFIFYNKRDINAVTH